MLLMRAQPSRAGSQALLAVLSTWEILHWSQDALVLSLSHQGAGYAGKPQSQPHPFFYSPLATRGEAVLLESSSAVLPQITCSLDLRAWHGTYRVSAMSTTGPGWGMRPWRVRQPQPPPE